MDDFRLLRAVPIIPIYFSSLAVNSYCWVPFVLKDEKGINKIGNTYRWSSYLVLFLTTRTPAAGAMTCLVFLSAPPT